MKRKLNFSCTGKTTVVVASRSVHVVALGISLFSFSCFKLLLYGSAVTLRISVLSEWCHGSVFYHTTGGMLVYDEQQLNLCENKHKLRGHKIFTITCPYVTGLYHGIISTVMGK